jgi:hypothetical protein
MTENKCTHFACPFTQSASAPVRALEAYKVASPSAEPTLNYGQQKCN